MSISTTVESSYCTVQLPSHCSTICATIDATIYSTKLCSINTVYLPTDESTVIAAVPPTDSTANHQTQCTINKSTIGPAVK